MSSPSPLDHELDLLGHPVCASCGYKAPKEHAGKPLPCGRCGGSLKLRPLPWFVGLDLGKRADFVAVPALQRVQRDPSVYHLRFLARWRRETYPETIRRVGRIVAAPDLAAAALVVDRTGVGEAVFDVLLEQLPGRQLIGISITAGSRATRVGKNHINVPKRELVAAVEAVLISGRLKIAADLPLIDVIQDELANFTVKISEHAHESFEGGSGTHDDVVSGISLALWLAENARGTTLERDLFVYPNEEDVRAMAEGTYNIGGAVIQFPDDDDQNPWRLG
jgi:hypothetical protein